MLYFIGRAFQLIGLLAMPSAMWVAEIQRDEALSIGVFVGAGIVFLIGLFLTNMAKK
jgi:hypothetical protein